MSVQLKSAVSVTEMARMVGLSRSRFYQLIGSAFPQPIYDVSTKRPLFDEEMQAVCLEVKRRNCGIDGRAVMFYSRGAAPLSTKRRTKRVPEHANLIAGIKSLGLEVTAEQVDATIKDLYPNGITALDQGEVIRSVFIHLQRRNSADNLDR